MHKRILQVRYMGSANTSTCKSRLCIFYTRDNTYSDALNLKVTNINDQSVTKMIELTKVNFKYKSFYVFANLRESTHKSHFTQYGPY